MIELDKIKVSLFKLVNILKPVGDMTLAQVFSDIQSDKYLRTVESVQDQLKNKYKLEAYSSSGTFTQRGLNYLVEYNGVVCLNLDNVKDPVALKVEAKKIPWVFASYITPSYQGLKVFAMTEADPITFKDYEAHLGFEFRKITGFSYGRSGLSRLQFMSYDPYMYINENATIVSL